nr:hypothetical protein [uncultured Flavobacterium sp.]
MTDNKIINQHDFKFTHQGSEISVSIKSYESPAKKSEFSGDLHTVITIHHPLGVTENSISDTFDDEGMKTLELQIKQGIHKLIPQKLN